MDTTAEFLTQHRNALKLVIARVKPFSALATSCDYLQTNAERLLDWLDTFDKTELSVDQIISMETVLTRFYINVNDTIDVLTEDLQPPTSPNKCQSLQQINRRLWMVVVIAAIALYHFW